MTKKHAVFVALLFVAALIGIGCSSDNNPLNPDEKIIFQNRTALNGLSCYVDDQMKGTVDSGRDLEVEGNYEGDRVLRVNSGGTVLAVRSQHIDQGMTFYWELR